MTLSAVTLSAAPVFAAECAGNPNALGTSRTLVVDPSEHQLLGGFQYRETLPLNDREVVITFDDGPLPPYSTRILDILARECVKATYFMVGKMARAFPKIVRRTHEEGHTIANHTQSHSYALHKQPLVDAWKEVDDGFESLRVVLGNRDAVAPFFRFPGLLRETGVEQHLAARGIMSWSIDVMGDDWTRISAAEINRRTLMRLEAKGKGIILLHDIQPATAVGLPDLLRELKARGFRVVHVVPTGPGRPKTPTTPEQWVVRQPPKIDHGIWANAIVGRPQPGTPALESPSIDSFGADDIVTGSIRQTNAAGTGRGGPRQLARPVMPAWPDNVPADIAAEEANLPAPAIENYRYVRVGKQRPQRTRAAGSPTSSGKAKTTAQARKKSNSVASTSDARDAGKASLGKASLGKASKSAAATHGSAPEARSKSKSSPTDGKVARAGGKSKFPAASGHQIQLSRPQASLTDQR